jgi:hypothetical protein
MARLPHTSHYLPQHIFHPPTTAAATIEPRGAIIPTTERAHMKLALLALASELDERPCQGDGMAGWEW